MSILKDASTGLYTTHVDGKKYEFEEWGAEEALDILLDVVSIVGGPLGAVASAMFSGQRKGLMTKISKDFAGTVVSQLASNMHKDKALTLGLIKKLTSHKALRDGRPIDFNRDYKKALPHMWKVGRAAFEAQYGDFFDAVNAAQPSPALAAQDTTLGKPT